MGYARLARTQYKPERRAPLLPEDGIAMENTKAKRRYTVGEEVANSVSHGVGALLSIAALVLLIVRAVSHGGGVRLAAALLMGIYLLIAGSYAPFALVALADRGGIALGIAVWAVAIVGIVAECFLREKQPKWLTALIYVILGWAVVFHIVDLYQVLPAPAFWLLLAGGISYTVGALFYIPKNVRYLHFIFHLFTLAGSVCITLSALLFVL